MKRYAIANVPNVGDMNAVKRYLPDNYKVTALTEHEGRAVVVIEGRDNAGWTLDGYVLPRLASGMYFGREIDLSHEVMQRVPINHEKAAATQATELLELLKHAEKVQHRLSQTVAVGITGCPSVVENHVADAAHRLTQAQEELRALLLLLKDEC